jgi:Transposase IS116/IS110/IS902 family
VGGSDSDDLCGEIRTPGRSGNPNAIERSRSRSATSPVPTAEKLARYAGCTCRVQASGDKLCYGRLRPDVNRYLKWAFIEAANAICLMRRRYPHRHVSRLYERIARRKGHPKAIGAVARHPAEATYCLVSKTGSVSRASGVLVSSTGVSATSHCAPGTSTFACDIPEHSYHAAWTAKIWLRRNRLTRPERASSARIDSGLAAVCLVCRATRDFTTARIREGPSGSGS